MLLALGLEAELSLKLLHDSCGLRLMPNVRQQCSIPNISIPSNNRTSGAELTIDTV